MWYFRLNTINTKFIKIKWLNINKIIVESSIITKEHGLIEIYYICIK